MPASISEASSQIELSSARHVTLDDSCLTIADIHNDDHELTAEATAAHADAANPEDILNLIDMAVDHFGSHDYLIDHESVEADLPSDSEYTLEEWNRVLGFNLGNVFYSIKYRLSTRGRNSGETIMTIPSVSGDDVPDGAQVHVAVQRGVVGLTRTSSMDPAVDRVWVNAIGLKLLITTSPAEPNREVAKLAVFLSPSQTAYISGSYVLIDGWHDERISANFSDGPADSLLWNH